MLIINHVIVVRFFWKIKLFAGDKRYRNVIRGKNDKTRFMKNLFVIFVGEKRDPHYVRRETRKNSSGQIQSRVWQPFPGSGVGCAITLHKSRRKGVGPMRSRHGSGEICALWSRRVQPIFLRQTRMTRITSGVQSSKHELSAAVNPSRYERLYCGMKKQLEKIRNRWKPTLFFASHYFWWRKNSRIYVYYRL